MLQEEQQQLSALNETQTAAIEAQIRLEEIARQKEEYLTISQLRTREY